MTAVSTRRAYDDLYGFYFYFPILVCSLFTIECILLVIIHITLTYIVWQTTARLEIYILTNGKKAYRVNKKD